MNRVFKLIINDNYSYSELSISGNDGDVTKIIPFIEFTINYERYVQEITFRIPLDSLNIIRNIPNIFEIISKLDKDIEITFTVPLKYVYIIWIGNE